MSHVLLAHERDRVGARGTFSITASTSIASTRSDGRWRACGPARIPHPRIGFFGNLRDQLVDFDLLERLARELPHVQVVLVGDATRAMERLTAHSNIHWFGFRPYNDVPRYGAGFDVAIMPWNDNEWIRNCNPIKLKEYLALGLPVVSTDFPEVRRYESVVRIARDADDFVRLVAADDPRRRTRLPRPPPQVRERVVVGRAHPSITSPLDDGG